MKSVIELISGGLAVTFVVALLLTLVSIPFIAMSCGLDFAYAWLHGECR